MEILGIDVGGSGIKGAPVNTDTGELLAERVRIKTPDKAEPQPMAQVAAEITRSFNWKGPVGIGFPAPIKSGVAMMAANISPKWVGTNADDLFTKVTGYDWRKLNRTGCSLVWGHPQGPTLTRVLIEALEEAVTLGGGYVLIFGCAAGDVGIAALFEVSEGGRS